MGFGVPYFTLPTKIHDKSENVDSFDRALTLASCDFNGRSSLLIFLPIEELGFGYSYRITYSPVGSLQIYLTLRPLYKASLLFDSCTYLGSS